VNSTKRARNAKTLKAHRLTPLTAVTCASFNRSHRKKSPLLTLFDCFLIPFTLTEGDLVRLSATLLAFLGFDICIQLHLPPCFLVVILIAIGYWNWFSQLAKLLRT
jgi:hypothetical protein